MHNLPADWTEENNVLHLVVKCKDFKHALELVNRIGAIAEKLQHHPDITIRNYNEVFVSTTTHDADELTVKDYDLANEINKLPERNSTK